MIEAALIQILATDAAVLGMIGTASQVCIAGDGEPRKYPKLVIDPVQGEYHRHSQGVLRMRSQQIKVHAWAERAQQAHALADAVESALENYTGVAGGESITAVLLKSRTPRQQEIAGANTVLYCQTILMTINAGKAGS